jgi:succinyl-diaminopimelate desuccinylase
MENMEIKSRIEDYFSRCREQIIERIGQLIAVRSINGPAQPGLPFGEGPAEALELALQMADDLGLRTRNIDNYVGVVDVNDLETKLGILVHLDVVPAGEHWKFEPYSGTVKGGKLYGRGATDDKGPAVALLYALAAVKELGVVLNANVQLIIGTDEESGSRDIHYYFANYPKPPYIFAADGEFPVFNTEKGGLHTSFSAEFAPVEAGTRVLYARGGLRSNVVPGDAEALIEGVDLELARQLAALTARTAGADYTLTDRGQGRVHIAVKGRGRHASEPQSGLNAVTALIALLSVMPIPDSPGQQAIKSLAKVFPHGDVYGQAAGIAMSDDISGSLTVTFSLFDYTPTQLTGVLDCRVPVCATEENTLIVLADRLEACGILLKRSGFTKAHHTPAESPFIQVLLGAYEKYTGSKGRCQSIGGWSYAHFIEGAVIFGPAVQGTPSCIHGPDEFVIIEDLLTAAKIYTQVIIDCCGADGM